MTTEKVAWERNALTKIFFLQHSAFVFPSHSASSSSTFFSKARLAARFGFVCLGGLLSSFVRSFHRRPPKPGPGGGALPRMESLSSPGVLPLLSSPKTTTTELSHRDSRRPAASSRSFSSPTETAMIVWWWNNHNIKTQPDKAWKQQGMGEKM